MDAYLNGKKIATNKDIEKIDDKVNVDDSLFELNKSNPKTYTDLTHNLSGKGIIKVIHQRVSDNGTDTFGYYDNLLIFAGDNATSMINVAFYDHKAKIASISESRCLWSEDIAWKSDIDKLQSEIDALKKQIGGGN